MSAVYDDVKQKAMRRQMKGFATMHGDAPLPASGEYSSSSLGHYMGSAFMTGAAVVYALQGDLHGMGDRGKIFPIRGAHMFPVVGDTHTSTMSIGGAWVTDEPEAYNSGVVNVPWTRRVLFSGHIKFRTSDLGRRAPSPIIGDFSSEENG